MRNGNVGFAFSVFLFTVFYFLGYACNILFSMRFFLVFDFSVCRFSPILRSVFYFPGYASYIYRCVTFFSLLLF